MVGNQTLPTASCLVPRMVTAPGMTSLGEKTLECDVELRVRFTSVPLTCTRVRCLAGEMARARMHVHYRLCVRNMRKNLPERPRTRRTPRPAQCREPGTHAPAACLARARATPLAGGLGRSNPR